MDSYVAVISHHGKPESLQLFGDEAAARQFALDLSGGEGWEDKSKEIEDHDDHVHESEWLEDWGDDDGCGVVVGAATAP